VLRQPIARVIANAETIRTRLAGPLSEDYTRYAADIAAAGQHLMGLVDDLADLDVIEAENFSTIADAIDLADAARRAAGILSMRAREKGITISAPALDVSLPAVAEFRRVLQILLNLVGNAIRYSPENRRSSSTCRAMKALPASRSPIRGRGCRPRTSRACSRSSSGLDAAGMAGRGWGSTSRVAWRARWGELSVVSVKGEGPVSCWMFRRGSKGFRKVRCEGYPSRSHDVSRRWGSGAETKRPNSPPAPPKAPQASNPACGAAMSFYTQ
jgi:hypothetical protein